MNGKTKRTVRTVLQVLLAVALFLPVLLDATGLRPSDVPWLAGVVAVAGVVARVMQSAAFERLLALVGLGTDPVSTPTLPGPGAGDA